MNKPKLVAVMPIYRRKEITIETLKCLKKQAYVTAVIAVGSSKQDELTAKAAGAVFVHHNNIPLSEKYKAGFAFAKRYDPDALLLCGSDDVLSPNWTEQLYPLIEKGWDIVGKSSWYYCKAMPQEPVKIIGMKYGPIRETEPIGAGRLFSGRILRKADFVFCPPIGVNRKCDWFSLNFLVQEYGAKPLAINNNPQFNKINKATKILSIKGPWECADSYDNVMRIATADVDPVNKSLHITEEPTSSKEWLASYFPDLQQSLEKIIPTAQWEE